MPTIRKDRGNCWFARASLAGKTVCKLFGQGKKYGPEWRAAKAWEEEQKKIMEDGRKIYTDFDKLLNWGEQYLSHVQRTMSSSTYAEKKVIFKHFFSFCSREKIISIQQITPAKAYQYLAKIADNKTANVANKYRKNLLAGWNWGMKFVEDFPLCVSPFLMVNAFVVEKKDRYVPPEEDIVKVLHNVQGQDLVLLLTYYFTGARRGEVFRLQWEKDIRLDEGKIRLIDHKSGNGKGRSRWLDMHPELKKALSWWKKVRPCNVENVFFQTHCDSSMGLPFKSRQHFMERICKRAGVKPFSFHSIRHKSAAITFTESGLGAAQLLMGHYRATTTDNYVKSAGLYTDQSIIQKPLGDNVIGQAASELLKKNLPLDFTVPEADCTQRLVH